MKKIWYRVHSHPTWLYQLHCPDTICHLSYLMTFLHYLIEWYYTTCLVIIEVTSLMNIKFSPCVITSSPIFKLGKKYKIHSKVKFNASEVRYLADTIKIKTDYLIVAGWVLSLWLNEVILQLFNSIVLLVDLRKRKGQNNVSLFI